MSSHHGYFRCANLITPSMLMRSSESQNCCNFIDFITSGVQITYNIECKLQILSTESFQSIQLRIDHLILRSFSLFSAEAIHIAAIRSKRSTKGIFCPSITNRRWNTWISAATQWIFTFWHCCAVQKCIQRTTQRAFDLGFSDLQICPT